MTLSQEIRPEPTSYWHATSEPIVPDASLPARAEVVVIGGGLLGCWTTYWLARSGVPVVLLEKRMIGWGATGRNGGFLVGGTASGFGELVDGVGLDAARQIETLAAEGLRLAADIIREESIDCDFRTPGTLSLALTDDAMERYRHDAEMLSDTGFTVEIVDRESIGEMIHTPLGEEIRGGVYGSTGNLLHSERYLCGIARAAQRHGARLVQADVTGLTTTGNGSRITTSIGDLDAKQVVVALNAWTDTLIPTLSGLVVPVRGQILAYEPSAPVFETAVGSAVTPTGEYWQQVPDGSIVIGGCRAVAPNGDVGLREMVPTPDVTDAIERVLPRLFPELSTLKVARRWAGLMAFTSDNVPVADAAPEMPGVWVTGGYCGHGMPFGARVGELLAESVITGTAPTALYPLRIGRPTLTPLTEPT